MTPVGGGGRVYGSVCSGIEAASVAWSPLGWEPAFFAEIDPFPCAVLNHRYPGVPNLGDFTTIRRSAGPINLLVGGTPCQSFSVAGLRGGMADARGNLALEFLRLADRLRPEWVVWENVPGVLSSSGGRDFGAFLGGLAELGYGWAYRVLDAQHFGVPQRRRRVFVVGRLGDWRGPAAVLFERHSLSGNPPPSREAGPDVAGCLGGGSGKRGWCDDLDRAGAFVPTNAHSLRSKSNLAHREDADTLIAGTLTRNRTRVEAGLPCPTLHEQGMSIIGPAVRRLTPLECERLQGFPDNWTAVPYRGKPAADGPRYKAIGNSMAIPPMAWLGQRIDLVSKVLEGWG